MRTFQSLTQTLERWWRHARRNPSPLPSKGLPQPGMVAAVKTPEAPARLLRRLHQSESVKKIHPPVMLGLAVVSLTSAVGYRFYNQPQLAAGIVSPATIRAPQDGRFEDKKTTEEKRKAAQTGIVPILKRDGEVTAQQQQALDRVLGQVGQLRQSAGRLPFLPGYLLSQGVQQYLRSCPEGDWQAILAAVQGEPTAPASPTAQAAIAQLRAHRQKVPPQTFASTLGQISRARQQYARVEAELPAQDPLLLNPDSLAAFLRLRDPTWQVAREGISQAAGEILTQGVPPGMPPELLQETIALHLKGSVPPQARPGATQLLLAVLSGKPNLTVDREATQHRAEAAARAVEPVWVEAKQGETIVAAGETIDQQAFVLLDGFGLSRRETNWIGLAASGGLVVGAVAIFCFLERRVHRSLRRRDHLLVVLLSLTTPLLAIADLRYTNLPVVGLLASSFYGPALAVTQVTLVAGMTAFAADTIRWEYLLAGAAGGWLAAAAAGQLRSRDELARLGAGVGLMQGGVYFLTHLILSATAGIIWYVVLPGAILYGLTGMAWSIVALGISPYLERVFDLVTPIRLVELSNPNCPLLKRLATEAPGTFQHTLFVACLAEAAAREFHGNVELVRAGTLYHDIGKMHDPLGFIENQMGGPNKHDSIDDPWQSVEIIKKHVSEGLAMARKYGLPRAIQDFIPEHQGTLLVAYFYHQARQKVAQRGDGPVDEADFRYPGPIPQSRETALVMLADGCEAALRSLREATPEVALATIGKIFKARWQDGQLKDSGIEYEELPRIAEVFVRVWQQFHHQRIPYPKGALEPR